MSKATLQTIDKKVMSILARLPKAASTQKFALPALKKGEVWILGQVNADGRVTHTILLPGEATNVNHKDATAWAKKQGGDLPDRIEQAVLHSRHAGEFQKAAYWSNETHASGGDSAWCQSFDIGAQYYTHKSNELHGRAVRRVTI